MQDAETVLGFEIGAVAYPAGGQGGDVEGGQDSDSTMEIFEASDSTMLQQSSETEEEDEEFEQQLNVCCVFCVLCCACVA